MVLYAFFELVRQGSKLTVSVPRHFVHLSPVGFELLVEKFLRFIYKARLDGQSGAAA